ncbi:MAG TPA: phosphate ABC transporter permease subunit PstC [Solirubrobacteraceae bacterium]|nr:phosphate ABC transporter permease subunit PstC [Solirubrobacteraceae bacterium]
MLERLREPWTDQRAERVLGALACLILGVIVFMIVFVAVRAWPSFHANGLSWFSAKGNVDVQLSRMVNSGANPTPADYQIGAWPLIYATLLTTVLAAGLGLVFSTLSAIFIVEFAPEGIRRLIVPIVRLLAAVPSVIYGLIGILVLAPFVGNHLISQGRKKSVEFVIQLSGTSLLVAVVILTIMITPIMIAITVDGLYAIPRSWKEGAVALGVNRWRAMWTVTVRAARPAILAGAVLATARAFGEAIMISMVSGSKGFAPNPADGLTFIFEPVKTLASNIVENAESINAPAMRSTLYAMALLLLLGGFGLSIASWIAKQPLKKYGTRG